MITMTENALKTKLETLAKNKFQLPEEVNVFELAQTMLKNIGSTDSDLRDGLIYSAFATWILEYNLLSGEELRTILHLILSDTHMRYKLGEQNTDSVFTRSFSVLLLPLILIRHRSDSFLEQAEIMQVKQALLHYLQMEKDLRGYVDEKGWAHALAHSADALDDLILCSTMAETDILEVLQAIQAVICVGFPVYAYGEDERFVTPVLAAINRQLLTKTQFEDWIQGFADPVLSVKSMPENVVIRANVKSFLQSLYFRLKWNQQQPENQTQPEIIDAIYQAIDKTLYEISFFTR